MVKCLTSQSAPRRPLIRWITLKGLIAIIVFLAVAVLAEYAVVVYAMGLGVKDVAVLRIDWPVTIIISPLFHLVPTAIIITLLFTWIYFTKKLSAKSLQTIGKTGASGGRRMGMKQPVSKASQTTKSSPGTTKPGFAIVKGFSNLWKKIYFARATIESALVVFLVFLALVLLVSFLVYPALIYQTIAGSYQGNSSLYNFVVSVANSLRGFAEAVSPIGWIATAINNGLLAIASGIRGIGLGLGGLISPLADLDPAGKYLVFQNVAAWISVLSILFYGEYAGKSYRYRKK
jgi:hypothetical protein